MESIKPETEPKPDDAAPAETLIVRSLVLPGILYAVAFATAEFVTYLVKDYAGIICYFAIFLSLIITSATNKDAAQRRVRLALCLVPLIRIVSLAVPLAEISVIFWYLIIAVPVLAGVFMVSRTLKYNVSDIGLNGNKPVIQFLVAATGVVLGNIDYFILRRDALNSQLDFQATLFPVLILIVASGFAEELAFRGVMQRAATALNSWGWIYIAFIYALLQIGQGSALHCLFIFGVGLYFGWIVKTTGSIVGVAFSHGLFNIVLYLMLPHIF
jgi:uncharacterized protein